MQYWQNLIAHQSTPFSLQERRKMLQDNFRRGRLLAFLVICLETVLIAVDIWGLATRSDGRFSYGAYLILYSLMLVACGLFLLMHRHFQEIKELTEPLARRLEWVLLGFVSLIMVWGSIVTLLDQAIYGQTLVFMVNMIACAVIFIVSWRQMLIPFALSSLLVLIGLPFFQTDKDVLLGHFVNLIIFIALAWLASRLLNQAYLYSLTSRLDMERTNELLAEEIDRNQLMNEQLSQVNFQLRNLSFIDELTKVANRRGLRNFIDQVFELEAIQVEHLGVLMIDLDRFKQYNDSFGHIAGDQALTSLADVLASLVQPPTELVARWGGEEFIMLSFHRDVNEVNELAEQIRANVEKIASLDTEYGLPGSITVSIGVSFKTVGKPSDVGPVIADADMAMYSAKRAGRNKVWSHPPRVTLSAVTSPEQAETVAALARKIWREHYTPIIGADQVEYMLANLQSSEAIWQEISEADVQYDLIRYQGDWAGYMASFRDEAEETMFLSKLYVDRMYRGNGLGRMMLDALIDRCRNSGIRKIWLTVNKGNKSAIAIYEKMGFVQTASAVKDIGGGFAMDDYVMTLTLAD